MTPNVARLLVKWGVSDVIGDNLVEFEELNMRRKDGMKVRIHTNDAQRPSGAWIPVVAGALSTSILGAD